MHIYLEFPLYTYICVLIRKGASQVTKAIATCSILEQKQRNRSPPLQTVRGYRSLRALFAAAFATRGIVKITTNTANIAYSVNFC